MDGLGAAEAAAAAVLEEAALEVAKSGKKSHKAKKAKEPKHGQPGLVAFAESPEDGISMLASAVVEKPWRSAMVEPSDVDTYGDLESLPNIQVRETPTPSSSSSSSSASASSSSSSPLPFSL